MERDGHFWPCSSAVCLRLKDDRIFFSSEILDDPPQHLNGRTFMEHLDSLSWRLPMLRCHADSSHAINLFSFMSFKVATFSFSNFLKWTTSHLAPSLLGVARQRSFSFLSSLAQKFRVFQSCFNQYTVIIMGKPSKNQNYFLVNAVILENFLTCFIEPYNYIGGASLKHWFSSPFMHTTPSNPDANARPIPRPISCNH